MQSNSKLLIVSHKYLPQMDDDLVIFLNKHTKCEVLHIMHSFSDAKDRCSYYNWYKNGALYKEHRSVDFKMLPEPLLYLKEFFYTLSWIITSGRKWDCLIGMDGLCSLFGNVARALGLVSKTVFWAVDFVPTQRFSSKLKHKIYEFINTSSYTRVDEMWDLSPRMKEARKEFLGVKDTDYKKHRVVPYGMWLSRIKVIPYESCEKNTLVFMGHLIPKQGVQLILQALPELVKKVPNLKFKIIGDGSFRKDLEALAAKSSFSSRCEFLGKIKENKDLEVEVANSSVAIAPYMKELDTWSYYADPGKVKTYLGCGVPVLLTDIPWNAREIEESKCGLIITEDPLDIATKLEYLMRGDVNALYRNNALKYAKSFDYQNICTDICSYLGIPLDATQ